MHTREKKTKVALDIQICLCSRHAVGWVQVGAPCPPRGHTETSTTPRSPPDTLLTGPAGEELGWASSRFLCTPPHPTPQSLFVFPYCISAHHAEVIACNIMADREKPVTFSSFLSPVLTSDALMRRWGRQDERWGKVEGGGEGPLCCCSEMTNSGVRSFIFNAIKLSAGPLPTREFI